MNEIVSPHSRGREAILCPVKETKVYPWVCIERCKYYELNTCPGGKGKDVFVPKIKLKKRHGFIDRSGDIDTLGV